MQTELQRMHQVTEALDHGSTTIGKTDEAYSAYGQRLQKAGALLSKLKRKTEMDSTFIWYSFLFFVAVCCYIMLKRLRILSLTYWAAGSAKKKAVRVISLDLNTFGGDEEGGAEFGELCVVFETQKGKTGSWQVEEYGLIYTDKLFLQELKALVSRGRERSLIVDLHLRPSAFFEPVHTDRSPSLWGRDTNDKLPTVEKVTITVSGGVEDDQLEQFYDNVMGTVISFNNELKGHKKTCVRLLDDDLRTDFQRRFMAQQAGLNLCGGPYKLSSAAGFGESMLCVERRNAAT
ncbi:unnamed protein product [Vitrella brassicaformis CCMP3155]|uniref:Sec20 C-terminal domain-containing protein n=1 Tax=Vitrella brassicaformis (strain CCMP3155) TaxID=1169540 RepID=A0A0G4GD73_VITBC|nr:unnamed protein product [Vitrella brassicaformis CCMP3155]|eukprot:CEM27206.1 unnamed protein product [Vitrella brassicaformis CCMP3155]